MLQRSIEVCNADIDMCISLEPITEANVDIAASLMPPDDTASKWLIKEDAELLQTSEIYGEYLDKPDEQRAWFIRIGGVAVGVSHLWGLDIEQPGISTFITRSANIGRGIGTMARAGLIASHVFRPGSPAELVQSCTLLGNTAASRSLEKMGFYVTDYITDETGEYRWQNVDGKPNCMPRWVVINPHHSSVENEYAQTELGRVSQAKFTEYTRNLQISVS